ncbi:MAG: FGGY family carbohydrate kinase [Actinomycetota bacterium]|nr:FGGY family carbohydrate kinase [Actinomycetota bacterium]MDQ6947763.1 FGGY family carbohydrate kinase [Actinomycetota bacterium]
MTARDTELLVYALLAIGGIVALITVAKMHAFLALTTWAIFVGLIAGHGTTETVTSFENRVGNSLGYVGSSRPLGRAVAATGTPIHSMAPLTKLVWFHEHEPAVVLAARPLGWDQGVRPGPAHRECVMDRSMASTTGLFDLETGDWWPPALGVAGVDREQLRQHRLHRGFSIWRRPARHVGPGPD